MKFNMRLRSLRSERGLRQKDIFTAIGVTERSYQRYELEDRLPKAEVLIALADYFDVSLDYLVGRDNDK